MGPLNSLWGRLILASLVTRRSRREVSFKRNREPVIAHEAATARSLEQRYFTDAPEPAASGQVPGRQHELPGAVAVILRLGLQRSRPRPAVAGRRATGHLPRFGHLS